MKQAMNSQNTSTGTATKFPNSIRPSTEGRQNFSLDGDVSLAEPIHLFLSTLGSAGSTASWGTCRTPDATKHNYCEFSFTGLVSGETRLARVIGVEAMELAPRPHHLWSSPPEFTATPAAMLNFTGMILYDWLRGVDRVFPTAHSAATPEEDVSAASILAELRALAKGWSGPKSVPPSAGILRDTADLLDALNFDEAHAVPDVAVDEDGSVTLTFDLADGRVLAFDLNGKERVLTTVVDMVDQTKSRSKLIRPVARVQIVAFLDEMHVEGFA